METNAAFGQVLERVNKQLTEVPRTPAAVLSAPEKVAVCASAAHHDGPGATSSVFFARVPPMVSYEKLLELFGKFGTVQHLNLFKRWATAKTSKGCGIVQYDTVEEANNALRELNGKYTFEGYPGCEGPMVVEPVDPNRLSSPRDNSGSKAIKPEKERPSASKVLGRLWGKAATAINVSSSSSHHKQHTWQQRHSQQLPKGHGGLAAAAVGAGCSAFLPTLSNMHPAVEALGIKGLLPLLGDGVSALAAAGSTGPASCSTPGPTQLLPILCDQAHIGLGCSSLPQLTPVVASAAVAASMAQVINPVSAGLCHLPNVASASMLGCPALANQGLSGAPASNSNSCNVSFTSQVSGFVPMSNPLLAAAQQQQLPLLLLDDAWASDGWEAFTSPPGCFDASSIAASCALNAADNYSMLDSSGMLSSLGEPAAAAGLASGQHCAASMFGSSSTSTQPEASGLLPRPAFAGGLMGSVGGVSGVLDESTAAASLSPQAVDGYLTMPLPGSVNGGLNVPAEAGTKAADSMLQQQQCNAIHLELCESSLRLLVPHIPEVAKMSGAEIQITAGPSGMQLHLQGNATQLDAACGLLRLLLPACGAA